MPATTTKAPKVTVEAEVEGSAPVWMMVEETVAGEAVRADTGVVPEVVGVATGPGVRTLTNSRRR